MKDSLQKRVDVASYWVSARISVLDGLERYEDSYAITQEFREWITSNGDHPEHLEESVLKFPQILNGSLIEEGTESDEKLEI